MEVDLDNQRAPNKKDKFAFPSFSVILEYFFNTQHNAITWGPDDLLVTKSMPVEVFSTALAFVRRVAFMEALDGEEILVDEDWERKLDTAVERDDKVREKLRVYFRRLSKEKPGILEQFMRVAWEGMVYEGTGVEGVRDVWVELVGVVPNFMLEEFSSKVGELRRCALTGMKSEGRATAARALGLLGSHPTVDQSVLKVLLSEMADGAESWEKAGGQELNRVHGGILVLGYLLARLSLRGRLDVLDPETITRCIDIIIAALLEARDQMVLDAAITSFSEICIFGVLSGNRLEKSKSDNIIERLGELGKKGKEKAILTLGYFSIIFHDIEVAESSDGEGKGDNTVQNILETLFSLHENRQIEVNFATGEAVASVAGGWESKGVKAKVDLDGFQDSIVHGKYTTRLKRIVARVLSFVKETKPALRKASYHSIRLRETYVALLILVIQATCVWMLSLLEFLGESAEVQSKLGEMQRAFRGFLVDRDGSLFTLTLAASDIL